MPGSMTGENVSFGVDQNLNSTQGRKRRVGENQKRGSEIKKGRVKNIHADKPKILGKKIVEGDEKGGG